MAFLKVALHLFTNLWQAHLGFGLHRDELYYLVCGQRLSWGYVDQAPLVAVQAHLAALLFGSSLAGLRLFSTLAGAGRVFLTGILGWQLGGRRAAQVLAMLCVLMAPQYLAGDSFLSMNSFESLFWMSFLVVLLRIQQHEDSRLWIVAGAIAGLGLLNKPSLAFFLIAAVCGLLLTPERRLLRTRLFPLAVLLTLVIVLPYLLWQAHHHWATWQYLRQDQLLHKYIRVPWIDFIQAPIDNLLPMTALVWLGGLGWLLRDRARQGVRWIGLTCVLFFLIMWALNAKDYYLAPAFPVLFAAGGVLWERVFDRKSTRRWRGVPLGVFATGTVIYGLLVLPMAVPVVSPAAWPRYLRIMHQHTEEHERYSTTILPQFFADRFGWQQLADEVDRIVGSLPPTERSHLAVLCDNYGEASAINVLGHSAPAISGHNSYFLWGPEGAGDELLVVTSQRAETLQQTYASVKSVGRMHHPLSMPYEQKSIYLVHGRVHPLADDWPAYRFYF